MDDAERARRGMSARREVLGDEHVNRAFAAAQRALAEAAGEAGEPPPG